LEQARGGDPGPANQWAIRKAPLGEQGLADRGRTIARLRSTLRHVVFYGVTDGVVSSVVGDVVEFFLRREEAERFIAECVADVPEWANELHIVAVDLHGPAEPSLS
jgi:hypothetical protein